MSILIWGWGSFNRRNHTAIRATCEHCGKLGMLKSHDVTRYFSLYFIPLIPLGTKRIIHECPACKMAREMPITEWTRLQRDELFPAIEAIERSATNRDTAIQAIGAAVTLGSPDEIERIIDPLLEHHIADAEVMARLGAACSALCLDEESRAAFDASLQQKPDPQVRTAYAVELMHQRRPDLAEAQITAANAESPDTTGGLLVLLARAYAEAGDTDAAERVLEQLNAETSEPSKAVKTEASRLERNLQRQTGSRRAATPAALEQPALPSEGFLRRYAPMLVLPGIALAVLALIGVVGLSQQPKHVYLVNGLEVAYEAEVNGLRYELKPEGRRSISADYGRVEVNPVPGSLQFEPVTGRIASNPFWRVFDPPTVVINPDRAAVIHWQAAQYARNPNSTEPSRNEFHVGEAVHAFHGLDYRFAELPDEITIEGDGKPWRKTILQIRGYSAEAVCYTLTQENPDGALIYAEQRLRLESDNPHIVAMANWSLPNDRLVPVLDSLRDHRPVLVEVHRTFQGYMGMLEPDRDLEAEYMKLAEAEPNDADILYLAARMATEPAVADELYTRAIAGAPPPPHPPKPQPAQTQKHPRG
ncbi:MAG: tetratricopeptide repeat protein, partial [Planctomycetota bacterium]